MFEPVTKRQYQAVNVEGLPYIMHRAFNTMLSGRPGPVHLDLPMDVQAATVEAEIPDFDHRIATGRARPDATLTQQAARLLAGAQRPVMPVGGGVVPGRGRPRIGRAGRIPGRGRRHHLAG